MTRPLAPLRRRPTALQLACALAIAVCLALALIGEAPAQTTATSPDPMTYEGNQPSAG